MMLLALLFFVYQFAGLCYYCCAEWCLNGAKGANLPFKETGGVIVLLLLVHSVLQLYQEKRLL